MGIFDFLFGKKKEKNDSPKLPPTERRVLNESRKENQKQKKSFFISEASAKPNPQWKAMLAELIAADRELPNPTYYLKENNPNHKQFERIFLDAYNYGSGSTQVKPLTKKNSGHSVLDYNNATNCFLDLLSKQEKLEDPLVQTTLKGLVMGMIHDVPQIKYNSNILEHYTRNLLRKKQPYLASFFLEGVDLKDIDNPLRSIFNLIHNSRNTGGEVLKDELIEMAMKCNTPYSKVGVTFFESKEQLEQYLEFRTFFLGLDKTVDKPAIVKEKVQHEKSKQLGMSHLLKLLLYDLNTSYNIHKDTGKVTLDELMRNIDIEYYLLQDILKIFGLGRNSTRTVNGTLINKLCKNYFKSEPLDPQSYELIKECMFVCDTISRSKAINEFLWSKKDNLYNIGHSDLFTLQHSGVLHRPTVEHSYYGAKSEWNKYLYSLMTLISQIVTAKVVKENPDNGVHEINIGGESILIAPKDLEKINTVLYNSNIPYQLIDYYHYDHTNPNQNKKLISTLLLNEEESTLILSKIDKKVLSSRGRRWYENIRFARSETTASPLNNHFKSLSKKAKDEISSNRFIHDLKWKGIKNHLVDHFDNRRAWYDLMHELVSYSGTVEPSTTWMARVKKAKEKLEPQVFSEGLSRLTEDILQNEFWFNKENVKALRGVIWANTFLENEDACNVFEDLLFECYKKVPNVGPKSVSGGSSLMAALIVLDSEESYNVLKRLKERTRYDRFEKQLNEALKSFEIKSKSTVTTLKEGAMSDYGFLEGKKISLIRPNYFLQWSIKNRKVKTQWIDSEGNRHKKAPEISDLERKGNRTTTKILNESIVDFDERMDSYRFADISWSTESWKKNYLKHEFVSLIIDNYMWLIEQSSGEQLVVITKGGKTLDINDQWYILGEEDTIVPYHLTLVSKEVNEAWIDYFNKNQLIPNINYFYSPAYSIEEGMEALQAISGFTSNIYAHGDWHYHNAKSYELNVKELHYLGKVVQIHRPLKKNENDLPQITMTYHDLVPRGRNKKFDFKKLGPSIHETEISTKVRLECIDALTNRMVTRSLNQQLLSANALSICRQIPLMIFLEKVCERILEEKIFSNYAYKDFRITIDGKHNVYELSIEKQRVEIKGSEKANYRSYYNIGKPKLNYQKLLEMPFSPDDRLIHLLGAIEVFIDDANVKDKWLKQWIGAQNP